MRATPLVPKAFTVIVFYRPIFAVSRPVISVALRLIGSAQLPVVSARVRTGTGHSVTA